MNKMLLVFAHPDDESFSCGLTAWKYAKEGWSIELLTATKGEQGSSGPYEDVSGDALGVIRAGETIEAATVLGIRQVTFLAHKDGTLKEKKPGELEDVIYQKLIEFAPSVVITFDPTGVSNHPDHIKISYATTFAFQKYAKDLAGTRELIEEVKNKKHIHVRNFFMKHKKALRQTSFTDVVNSEDTPKLYYACVPESVITYLKEQKMFPVESFGKPVTGVEDKSVTTVIDGKEGKLKKLEALAKHKSQTSDVDRFYENESNPLIVQEFFILRMFGVTEVFMGKNDRVADRL